MSQIGPSITLHWSEFTRNLTYFACNLEYLPPCMCGTLYPLIETETETSPAYENCSGPMVQHYCHGISNIIAMELPSPHIPSLLEPPITVRTFFNLIKIKFKTLSNGMCGDGNSMAIMLDYRASALGKDFNSQVLKHREFWITFTVLILDILYHISTRDSHRDIWGGDFLISVLPKI